MLENTANTAQTTTHGIKNISADIRNNPTADLCESC